MAAPHHARLVRHLELRIERLTGVDDGKLRVSTPQARGWAMVVRGPAQLWTAVNAAIVEATVAGYARWQGATYDCDELTELDDPTEPARARRRDVADVEALGERRMRVSYSRDSITRPDVNNPAEWTPRADGRWQSPAGRAWRPDSKVARRIVGKRKLMGLPVTYDDYLAVTGDE